MAKMYRQRPSDIIGIDSSYAAYCFDEACMHIQIALQNLKKGETLNFDYGDEPKPKTIKHYNSLDEMYASMRLL